MSIKRAFNKENSYEISLNLDEKCSRGISYSSQIVFSGPCITPVSLALYVRCKCLVFTMFALLGNIHLLTLEINWDVCSENNLITIIALGKYILTLFYV